MAAKVLILSDSDGTNKKSQKASGKKKQLEETQLRDLTKVDLMVPINLIHWRGKIYRDFRAFKCVSENG